MYRKLAGWCVDHRWIVVGTWIGLFAVLNVVGGVVGAAYDSSSEIPDSESGRGFDTLNEFFPEAGGAFGGSIVFQADDVRAPEVEAAMSQLFTQVAELEEVNVVSPYTPFGEAQISEDGTIAFAQVGLSEEIGQTGSLEISEFIQEHIPVQEGLRVEIGGAALAEFEPPESELIGIGFAIVILIVSFGSVLAMGLPILVALVGVGIGSGGALILLSNWVTVPDFAFFIGVMIGLGVGIDYALFIVTRYRTLRRAGADERDAIVLAMDTAGRSVVFAGITVVLSLVGMLTIGLGFISGLGIAAAVTVAFTMGASITLLPALLAIVGDRIELTRRRGLVAAGLAAVGLAFIGLGFGAGVYLLGLAALVLILGLFIPALKEVVPNRPEKPIRETFWYRWSHIIQDRPWTFAIGGAVVLLVLSAPVLALRLGFSDEGNFSEDTTPLVRRMDLVAEGFGPGFNSPFLVAIEISDPSDFAAVEQIGAAVGADPGVANLQGPIPNNVEDPQVSEAFLFQVIPNTSPQDKATDDTVKRLRNDVVGPIAASTGIEANITGPGPINVDFSKFLAGRILLFFAAVLGVSFLLLMMVFRSLLVPLKAVIMNMLSISAAYGVVVALFQWGWFGGITGIEPAPIEPFVPMMLFAIVFGLSMDYEVFLLSRIKEEYDRTGDAKNSVADGLAVTARVITAAAAIMTVVFGAFLLEDDRITKLFGTGLSLAVFLDATLVRMLLVPATMELLGEGNWWLPKWLDRILPKLDVEGGHHDVLEAESAAAGG